MKRKIMLIIMMLSIINISSIVNAEGVKKMKVEIRVPRDPYEPFLPTDKIYDNAMFILETELPVKIYKTVKPVKFYEGKAMAYNYYLERPNMYIHPSPKDYVTKEEYDRNPALILDGKGRLDKDIYVKELPKGTVFELEEVILDSWKMQKCRYYVKLLSEPDYKDLKVDASPISIMAISGIWVSDWDGWFVNKEKRQIKKEKIPLINNEWAVELTKEEYKKYRETGKI